MGTKEFILKVVSDDADGEIVWQLPMQNLCMEITNELIRCKDCKHYWKTMKICPNTGPHISDYCKPDDYCSKAERKEE